jgi:DNA invertase Pin-like site-specific DNA recombinase
MQVLGYVRVSTEEQADSRAGIEAQRAAILAECKRRGWQLVELVEDAGYSAKDLRRPGIKAALEALERGDARALVVAKLDRLSRSMLDFTAVMAQAQKQGWALVALDCAVDTTTPAGEAMANVLATFAQFERRLIAQRTREAMSAKKASGDWRGEKGRKLGKAIPAGRPRMMPTAIVRRIERARANGKSLPAIAAALNADKVPTAQGGKRWYPSTVRSVLVGRGGRTPAST